MAEKLQQQETALSQPIDVVQVDGLVVLKIIKHCHGSAGEEAGADVVQGALLGLVHGRILEVTNCFPFPESAGQEGDEDDMEAHDYQIEMMRLLRDINVDHLHVGWYQSTMIRSSFNKTLLESQSLYQKAIEQSVVLLYDPVRTQHGSLGLEAYRLTAKAMDMMKSGDFTTERLVKNEMSWRQLFEQVPLELKNSHLVNSLLLEMASAEDVHAPHEFLTVGGSSVLESNMCMLMDVVDETSQDSNRYAQYLKQQQRQNQQIQNWLLRRQQENQQRRQRGEAPLPEEDVHRMFKTVPSPSRLDSLLLGQQLQTYSKQLQDVAGSNLTKLFMLSSLQSQ